MSFIPEIYEKRHKFYLNFVEEVIVQDLWEKVLNEEQAACAFLCAFYTTVKGRCNTSNEETSEIVYNSLKKKCLKNETYENFCQILEKHNNKLGLKSNIPLLNSELKKAFSSFEQIYLYYETKMQEKGEI